MLQSRRTRQFGSWLALFALWLQIGLSFGHVHAQAAAGPESAARAAHHAVVASPAYDPGGLGHHRAGDEACAICASIQLAASVVLPEPAIVGPRPADAERVTADRDDVAPPRPAPRSFQSRAPPAV